MEAQLKCTKRSKQNSAIKQLLAVMFFVMVVYTGFAADNIQMSAICAVSLTYGLRVLAGVLIPVKTLQCYSER